MCELLLFYAALSLLTLIFYGVDKWKARHNRYRIRESVLLSLSFFGGAVGGWLGMCLFHHKTKHWYFTAINFMGLLWQVLAAVYVYRSVGISLLS